MLVATLCERLAKVATPPATVAVNVPCNVPLPAARAAVMTVVLSLLRRLPNWSSIRTAGCSSILRLLPWSKAASDRKPVAAAALTTTLEEITGAKLPLLKFKFIVSATA
jgi:hypothetical protein